MVGKTISHYRLLEKIGAGGMGVVYKARDLKLNRLVALKFLPPEISENSEAVDRFINEAQTASALDHANICTIHEINETEDGQMFICMAYYEGETVNQKIERGPLTLDETISIVLQIGQGLQRAHQAGIIHRDIKPANIIVTQWGEVKILDFGIARLTGQDHITKTGVTPGTVAYMSPEQVQQKAVDHRTDIWSLGVMLYEMLSGHLPFSGDSEAAVVYSIVNIEPAAISEYRGDLPELLAMIVHKALTKHLDERYSDVEEILADLRTQTEESAAQPPAIQIKAFYQKRLIKYLAAATFVLMIGIAGLLWYFLGKIHDTTPTPLRIIPLTRYLGNELHPSFSPGGNQVAFAWNGPRENNYDIYIKLIGTESLSRLTSDPAPEFQPNWSPDGRTIAFLRQVSNNKTGVYLIPALGGQVRKLAELNINITVGSIMNLRIAWHPQGQWLVVSDKHSPSEPFGLFLISVDSGEIKRLTSPSVKISYGGDEGAVFSRDGQSLVFCRTASYGVCDLYLLDLADDFTSLGEPKRLTFDEHYTLNAVFAPNGKDIIYSSGSSLWQIPRSGSTRPKPLLKLRGMRHFALSRQGHLLAYSRQSALEINIWRVPLSDTLIANQRPLRLIASTAQDHCPQYSPDGKKIAFYSTRSGNDEVWVCDSDGSNPLQLTYFEGSPTGHPRWSPDGKSIVFLSHTEGQGELYIINSDGGSPKRLTTHPADDTMPAWSSNGNWIYFASNRNGQFQLWKIRPDGGEATQITQSSAYVVMDSPDGRNLYYSKDAESPTSLWKVPATGGEEKRFISQLSHPKNFEVVKDGIYFVPFKVPGTENEETIQFFNFTTGNIKTIVTLEKKPLNGIAVSPDHRFILYCQIDQEGMDLDLIENFR